MAPPDVPEHSVLPARIDPAVADALRRAARRHATPLYVVDAARIGTDAAEVGVAFPDPWLRHYRIAANSLPAIVHFLADRGFGASVESHAAWRLANRAGLGNERLVLAGRGKSDADLRLAVEAAAAGRPLRWVSIESASEAGALESMAERSGLGYRHRGSGPARQVDAVVRVGAPGAADPGERILAAASSSGGVRWRGLSLAAPPFRALDPWRDLVRRSVALLALLAGTVETLDTLDLGGGIPAATDVEPAPPPGRFAAEIEPLLAGLPHDRRPARVAVEVDRVVVARAGWLVSRVLHVDERHLPPPEPGLSPSRRAVASATTRRRPAPLRLVAPEERTTAAGLERRIGIDAGIAELPTIPVAGTRHPIAALTSLGRPVEGGGRFDGLERAIATVVGWTGTAGDTLGEHALPPLRRGDLVAIGDAGAYEASMWSSFGGRPRPAEMLLEPGGRIVIADRRGHGGGVR